MFTQEEREFIKNTMSNATVQGANNMRIVLSIIEKCDRDPSAPIVREVSNGKEI